MRILMFNPSYPPVPCGVGDYTRGLAGALIRTGHDVTVITATGTTPPSSGPPRVLPVLPDWDAGAFLRSRRQFARPRADLVISSFPAVIQTGHARLIYVLPALAKSTLGRPRTTFIVHEFVRTGEVERRLLALGLFAADRIVAVTGAERDAIVSRYPSLAARAVARENAPNVPVAPDDPAADARTRARLAPDRPVVGFFGFIWSADKGFEELLVALAQTEAVLVATGSLDLTNVYHAYVAGEIERLGLGDRVQWLGFLPDDEVGRVLRAVDAVVLPFRRGAESGYTSLLAALVNGAAVITTRGPQNPAWLRHEQTALMVEPCDSDALLIALRRVLSDDALARRLRAGARRLSFGWDQIVEAVIAPVTRRG